MKQGDALRVTVLGTRGSVPVANACMREFGGETSCYQVEAGGDKIFLDAGTGIARAAFDGAEPNHILLSHAHVDHILGLAACPAMMQL